MSEPSAAQVIFCVAISLLFIFSVQDFVSINPPVLQTAYCPSNFCPFSLLKPFVPATLPSTGVHAFSWLRLTEETVNIHLTSLDPIHPAKQFVDGSVKSRKSVRPAHGPAPLNSNRADLIIHRRFLLIYRPNNLVITVGYLILRPTIKGFNIIARG